MGSRLVANRTCRRHSLDGNFAEAHGRARNSVGYEIYDRLMSPVMQVVKGWRKRRGLKRLRDAADLFMPGRSFAQLDKLRDSARCALPLRPCAPLDVQFAIAGNGGLDRDPLVELP